MYLVCLEEKYDAIFQHIDASESLEDVEYNPQIAAFIGGRL